MNRVLLVATGLPDETVLAKSREEEEEIVEEMEEDVVIRCQACTEVLNINIVVTVAALTCIQKFVCKMSVVV